MADVSFPDTKKTARPRKDRPLAAAVLLALLFFVIAVMPIALSMMRSGRYRDYVSDLTDSLNSSHASGVVMVEKDGSSFHVPVSRASSVYTKLLNAGMGKEQKKQPDGAAVIMHFQDGSQIEFRESYLPEASAARKYGLFITYKSSAGTMYQYDTDQLTMDHVLRALQ